MRYLEVCPVGTYEVEGETLEGDELESEVELTHVMPAPENVNKRMRVKFPAGFFKPGTEVKFEVLVREASYNQTAVESCPFEYE